MSIFSSGLLSILKRISLTTTVALPLLVSYPLMAQEIIIDNGPINHRPGNGMPSYERVRHALHSVQRAINTINRIIARADGTDRGDHEDRGEGGGRYPTNSRPNNALNFYADGNISAVESDYLPENDRLAKKALLRISEGLQNTASTLTNALNFVGTPEFYNYQRNICSQTTGLIMLTRGGRTAADLPIRGAITSYDFNEIDNELYSVRSDVNC
ncbi:MAG: hypothetical protein HQK53_15285 [Oligoflexia bacterium]|nr:hypothetical protein [Oligoflexia bacterium]